VNKTFIFFQKTANGVFNSTNIDYILQNIGIKYLVVTGILTDHCISLAVKDAADRGYLVTCVNDACAAESKECHEAAIQVLKSYSWVTDTATVLKRFETMKKS
jgi:nicotinamidase-related amidase